MRTALTNVHQKTFTEITVQIRKQVMSAPHLNCVCSYGGAVADVGLSESAFAHRAGTLSSIKSSAHWASATQTPAKLLQIRKFYDSMREFVSGGAYFNCCDLDLKNYGSAYWGTNLQRLTEIKTKYDPSDVFRHAQSVPLNA